LGACIDAIGRNIGKNARILASVSNASITCPPPTIWIAPWHSRLVGTVFSLDAVIELIEKPMFLSEPHEPPPIRAEESMCVGPHEALALMMEMSRMDMSHGKTFEEMRMRWRDCLKRAITL
jgi:hypothetical protein